MRVVRHALNVVRVVIRRRGSIEAVVVNEQAVERHAFGANLREAAFGRIDERLEESGERKRLRIRAVDGSRNRDFGDAAGAAADEERRARGIEGELLAAV